MIAYFFFLLWIFLSWLTRAFSSSCRWKLRRGTSPPLACIAVHFPQLSLLCCTFQIVAPFICKCMFRAWITRQVPAMVPWQAVGAQAGIHCWGWSWGQRRLAAHGAGPGLGATGSGVRLCTWCVGPGSWALWQERYPGVAVALACGGRGPVASQSWCPQAGGWGRWASPVPVSWGGSECTANTRV